MRSFGSTRKMSGCRGAGGTTATNSLDASTDFDAFLSSIGSSGLPVSGQEASKDTNTADRLQYNLPDDSGPSRLVFPSFETSQPPGKHAVVSSTSHCETLAHGSGPRQPIFPSFGIVPDPVEGTPVCKKVKCESQMERKDSSDPTAASGKTEKRTKGDSIEDESTDDTEDASIGNGSADKQQEWKLPSYDELLKEEEEDEQNAERENELEEGLTEEERPKSSTDLDEAFSAFMEEVESLPKAPRAGTGVARRTVPAAGSVVQSLGTGEQQVLRLTSQFFPSPWQVLLLGPEATEDQIKKQFRKISLLIHPDKCKHPKANEAFQILTKGYEDLQKPEMMERYKKVVEEAKAKVTKQREKENKRRTLEKETLLPEDDAKIQMEIAEMCEKMLKEKQEHRQYAEECLKANERYEKEKERLEKEEEERLEKERLDFRKGQAGRVTSWRTFKSDVEDKSVKLLAFQGLRHVREQRKEVPGQNSSLKRKRPIGIDESYKDNWR